MSISCGPTLISHAHFYSALLHVLTIILLSLGVCGMWLCGLVVSLITCLCVCVCACVRVCVCVCDVCVCMCVCVFLSGTDSSLQPMAPGTSPLTRSGVSSPSLTTGISSALKMDALVEIVPLFWYPSYEGHSLRGHPRCAW